LKTTLKNQVEFGKKPKDIWHYVKIGFLLKGTIDVISLIPGVEKEKVFNVVDTVQQKLGIDVLNDYIIKDPELLTFRVGRVVSQAIKDHENQSLR
jgi:hypothetical protein